MSKDWAMDIRNMHAKYGVHEWIKENPDKLREFLQFRLDFLKEELEETVSAMENDDPEEIVDGLIDLCVVAIGTLDAFDINAWQAWDRVFHANLNKEVGVKEDRPNPLGLPDLIKNEDWEPPSHKNNHGKLVYTIKQ